MEINASFRWRGMTERSTSHVLSFSTSVLLFRGVAMQNSLPFGFWCFVRKEEWSCFVDQLSVAQYLFSPLSFTQLFLPWTGLPRKKEKKKEWKINREAQSDPIVSMRFSFKHLRKSIWVAEEWDQTVPSHFWSCQFKVPIEQRGRKGEPWLGGYRHLALTFCLRSCPLKVGLFSLSHSEAQCRATVWLTMNPLWYLYKTFFTFSDY